jgi:hypothetical protein
LSVDLFYSRSNEIPYSKAVPTIEKASKLHNQPQAATIKQASHHRCGFSGFSRAFPYLSVDLFYSRSNEIPYSKAVPTIEKASKLHNQPPAATIKQASHHQMWILSNPAERFLI